MQVASLGRAQLQGDDRIPAAAGRRGGLRHDAGGLVGIGAWLLWERRAALWARIVAAVVLLGTTAWTVALMSQASDFLPWLRVVVVMAGVLGAVALLAAPFVRAFAPIGAAAALTASSFVAASTAGARVDVPLPAQAPAGAQPLSSTLVSFSLEQDRWPDWAGIDERNEFTYSALKTYADLTGQPPKIRVGGDSEDNTAWSPTVTVCVRAF